MLGMNFSKHKIMLTAKHVANKLPKQLVISIRHIYFVAICSSMTYTYT